jgi:hypothetical protein
MHWESRVQFLAEANNFSSFFKIIYFIFYRETLSDRQIRELMTISLVAFSRVAMEMSQKDGQDLEKLSKLIEYLEEVLQRIKRFENFWTFF